MIGNDEPAISTQRHRAAEKRKKTGGQLMSQRNNRALGESCFLISLSPCLPGLRQLGRQVCASVSDAVFGLSSEEGRHASAPSRLKRWIE